MKKNNGQISPVRSAMDYAATAMEQMELYCTAHAGSPSAIRRPQLFFRSELWIALLGPSMGEGIVGIGPSVAAALRAFDAQYVTRLRPAVKAFGTAGALRPPKAFGAARRPYSNPKADAKSRADVSDVAWLS
jgi:hypothetical protein